MFGRVELIIAAVVVAAILGDLALNHGRAVMFLLLKFTDLVEYVAVWR